MNWFDMSSLPFVILHWPRTSWSLPAEMQGRRKGLESISRARRKRTFWRSHWYCEQLLNTFAAGQSINHHMNRTKF